MMKCADFDFFGKSKILSMKFELYDLDPMFTHVL